MMRMLTYLLLLLTAASAAAVDVPWPDREVWPQNPQARQIAQVMMPTPALLTGACEYSVPLYTIEAEGVSIPLSLQYRSNGIRVDNDSVKMTRFPGGYLDRGGNAFYYLTDFQGNNIAVVDAGGVITQRTHYYPYGELWRYPNGQQYLFSDKELTRADGRHAYTFPARLTLTPISRP